MLISIACGDGRWRGSAWWRGGKLFEPNESTALLSLCRAGPVARQAADTYRGCGRESTDGELLSLCSGWRGGDKGGGGCVMRWCDGLPKIGERRARGVCRGRGDGRDDGRRCERRYDGDTAAPAPCSGTIAGGGSGGEQRHCDGNGNGALTNCSSGSGRCGGDGGMRHGCNGGGKCGRRSQSKVCSGGG